MGGNSRNLSSPQILTVLSQAVIDDAIVIEDGWLLVGVFCWSISIK